MGLNASKIADGEISGPYADTDAERYATRLREGALAIRTADDLAGRVRHTRRPKAP